VTRRETGPEPRPGLVIRYSYLWASEAEAGREDGVKDRPCAIVLVLLREGEHPIVRVLPVTYSTPADPADALEIPQQTKQRLGLDSERSWVVLSEANDFIWPGPDLRPAMNGDLSSVAYGALPPGFMRVLRERLLEKWKRSRPAVTRRTE
jgi:hypothetical protein